MLTCVLVSRLSAPVPKMSDPLRINKSPCQLSARRNFGRAIILVQAVLVLISVVEDCFILLHVQNILVSSSISTDPALKWTPYLYIN